MRSEEKIIVALDLETSDEAMEIVHKLEGHANFFKIGLGLLAKGGLDLVRELKKKNKYIFLDLKLFDIQNTIEKAVKNISSLGVDFITVHGDPQVVRAAVMGRDTKKTKILAVTFLTSLDRKDLDQNLIKHGELNVLVEKRAEIAIKAGADGIIASPQETKLLRNNKTCSKKLIVTPGVRPKNAKLYDQKRVSTPSQAILNGTDHIVIGRPIYKSDKPLESYLSIASEIAEARSKN
tara:strand:+ start:2557 stop:3264 length:708 start_codon:yes stop_codon:yes gene_type:complete